MHATRNTWFTALVTLVKREYQEQRLLFLLLPLGMVFVLQVFIVAKLVEVGVREPEIISENGIEIVVNATALEQVLVNAEFIASLGPGRLASAMRTILEAPLFLVSATYWCLLLFYFLMTLYQQRQNRSILFWSSMPVSNTQSILSKLLAVYIIAGGIYLATVLLMQLQMLVSISIFGLFRGVDVWTLYLPNAQIFARFTEYAVASLMGILWCLPVHGALLLASSWAKRAPFAWVAGGAAVLILCELIITGALTDRFGRLHSRWLELVSTHTFPGSAFSRIELDFQETLAGYLSLELLLSVLLGCAFIALAIRVNRVDE